MIATMDRAEVICLLDVLPRVVPFLHERGLLDVEEVPLEAAAIPGFLKRVDLPDDVKEESHRLVELDRMLREIVPLLASKPTPADVQSAVKRVRDIPEDRWHEKARQWHREMRGLTRRRINANDNLEILNNYKQLLETVAPLLGPRKVRFGAEARAIVLKGEIARVTQQLQDRLKAVVGPEVEFIRHTISRNHLVGVLLYPEEKNDAVGRVLREENIIPVDTASKESETNESLADVLRRTEKNIADQKQALQKIQGELKQYAQTHGAELQAMHRIVADELAQYKVVDHFAESQMVVVMHGWIPADEMPGFRAAAETEFPGQVAINALPAKGIPHTRIPTLLRNPKWLEPFEVLLAILRPPTYGSYDATLLVAIGFILFFGFIVGDFVYGVVMFSFAHWVRTKWGHNRIVNNAGKVGYYMASSAMIFGILFGEYLGTLGEELWYMYAGNHYVPGMILHRAYEMEALLVVAVIIGTIHIVLSLVMGIRESVRHHHTEHALEKGGMLAGLLGIIVLVMHLAGVGFMGSAVFLYLAGILYIGGAAVILWAMGAMGLINVLEIFSLMGNVLSYARLMALGVAAVVIATLANQVAVALPFYIGYPLAALIHVFNIGLAMFSPALHSLRLNYVEFLPKFYTPEGRSYKPFRKEAL
jgi:V/A-type H+/Na+-transporting ATPase subunit I